MAEDEVLKPEETISPISTALTISSGTNGTKPFKLPLPRCTIWIQSKKAGFLYKEPSLIS